MHWRAQCHAKWRGTTVLRQKGSAPNESRTHISRHSTTSLQWTEKNGIWIIILLELFCTAFLGAELSISDSSGWISRLGNQYQNFWTQTYDWYILLHSTFDSEHADLFPCHIFTQRPMNDSKIERSYRRYFGRQQLPAYFNGNSIPMKKKSVVAARYLQCIKTFITLELSLYRKSGSTFSSSEQVAARSDCC